MTTNNLKQQAADAALAYVKPHPIIGVGTGTTVKYFIEALADIKAGLEGAVATSVETEKQLKAVGIPVLSLNDVGPLAVYVDGADEFDDRLCLLKGGGGALTREKIVASASRQFICIVDETKKVSQLGKAFPVPIEVIPMARSYVARELVKLGGMPEYRAQFKTDNGNVILDVHGLSIEAPYEWEARLNAIAGVVAHGLFISRSADVVLIGTVSRGVQTLPQLA